jgi:hypothetical protein
MEIPAQVLASHWIKRAYSGWGVDNRELVLAESLGFESHILANLL